MLSKLNMFILIISINIVHFAHALDANEWIHRMAKANENISFSGTYVVIEGDQTQTVKITQRYNTEQNKYQQLLQHLNGSNDLLYSDSKLALIKEANGQIRTVPNIKSSIVSLINELPQHLEIIQKSYDFELDGMDRIANRPTQRLSIKPKDQYRYGYQLWLDDETGLILRAAQIKQKQILAQFIFTEISLGLNPMTATWNEFDGYLQQHAQILNDALAEFEPKWNAKPFLGFMLQKHTREYSSKNQTTVEIITFSDGLANISIFIEDLSENYETKPLLLGHETRGALTALGAVYNHHQVMFFGDVPIETLKASIENIKYSDKQAQTSANTIPPLQAQDAKIK